MRLRAAFALALLACASATTAHGRPDDPPQSAREPEVPAPLAGILAGHNRLRARHCAPALRWSADLARVAHAWAEKLKRGGCDLQHSHGKYGENLAAATTGSLAAEDAVGMWYEENAKYSYRKPGFGVATGHFTQLVWVGSKRV